MTPEQMESRRRPRKQSLLSSGSASSTSTPLPSTSLPIEKASELEGVLKLLSQGKGFLANNVPELPTLQQINNGQLPTLDKLKDRVTRKMSTGSSSVNGAINRPNPGPMNAQQSNNGSVNGAGANANGYASVAAINASQQMDVNFIYEKLKELSEVTQDNRIKAQGVINGAEALAVSISPSLRATQASLAAPHQPLLPSKY